MSDPSGHPWKVPDEWCVDHHEALDAVMALGYEELRALARRHLGRERSDHTLQTTALVHEVYLRLKDQRNLRFDDRGHFMAVAAHLMRFVLVDYARRRRASKHGGGATRVSLDSALLFASDQSAALLELDAAMDRLAALDARKARVAEMRLFAGLSVAESASVLAVSSITIARDWRFARAWLERELKAPDRRG